jgi:para-nitrobenzyl esterase
LDRILTDPLVCAQRNTNKLLASQVPVYAYEFRDRTAPFYFPAIPGFQPLAYHTGDLQYLFPLYHGGPQGVVHRLNSKQAILSDEMVAAWTNFAWSGNPNGRGSQPWRLYKDNFILSEKIPELSILSDAQFSREHQCSFWDSVISY